MVRQYSQTVVLDDNIAGERYNIGALAKMPLTFWLPLVVSSVSLIFSGFALWYSHLSRFQLEITFSPPTRSLYKIPPEVSGDKENRTWWLPSFDAGFSFYNSGSRAGRIKDIRLILKITEHRSEQVFHFYPVWIVKPGEFDACRTERFNWIETCVERQWYPLIIPGKSSVHMHLIFEGPRWDSPLSGSLETSLQIFSSKSEKWVTLAK